jgi:hypothetical protein
VTPWVGLSSLCVPVCDAGDATVDRRGSHHWHDGLPARGVSKLESEGAPNLELDECGN